MAAITVLRHVSASPLLWGWGPVLFVLLGSVLVLLLPLVGVEENCCTKLRGIALLRCHLWGDTHRAVGHSTSLTVPNTALELLPQKPKPSKGRVDEKEFGFPCTFNINYLINSDVCDLCVCEKKKHARLSSQLDYKSLLPIYTTTT